MAEQSLIWQPKRSCDLQHFTLAPTELDRKSERLDPINWLVMSALFQFFLQKSELEGNGYWVNHAEKKTYTPFCPWVSNYLGNKNQGTKLNCLPPAWVYWLCSPDVTKQMGFPLGTSPFGTPWWVGSIVNETQTFFMA